MSLSATFLLLIVEITALVKITRQNRTKTL